MVLFGKKKKKELKKEEEYKKLSSDKILIKIFSTFSSGLAFSKTSYLATEKRDKYNNLVSINEDKNHNEELDFAIDDVYSAMNIVLGLKNLNQKEKEEKLKACIDRQEKLIKALDKYIELNGIYNHADEDLKLRDYRVMCDYIKNHRGQGNYFKVEDGLRVYEFQAIDGFLVPYWIGSDMVTQYPDHTRKKKITVQDDLIFQKEMANYKRERKLSHSLTMAIAINVILTMVLLFGIWNVWSIYQDQDAVLHGDARACVEYTSNINMQMANLMSLACVDEYVNAVDNLKEVRQEEDRIGNNGGKIQNLSIS